MTISWCCGSKKILWIQSERTYGGESRVLNQKVTFWVTGLGLSPKIYHFLTASLTRNSLLIGQLVISWKTAKAHLLLENRRAIDNLWNMFPKYGEVRIKPKLSPWHRGWRRGRALGRHRGGGPGWPWPGPPPPPRSRRWDSISSENHS